MRRCPVILFACLLVLAPIALSQQDDPAADYTKIREGMTKLSSLVGKWKAVATYYNGEQVRTNEGTYDVDWALDQTYLEFRVTLHSTVDPSRQHGFRLFMTYNPASHRYDCTYFYTRWALRVTATGEYDDAKKLLRYNTFIPLEDGVHDEAVHSTMDLSEPNKVTYTHYSRYSNQDNERMDVRIVLTREK